MPDWNSPEVFEYIRDHTGKHVKRYVYASNIIEYADADSEKTKQLVKNILILKPDITIHTRTMKNDVRNDSLNPSVVKLVKARNLSKHLFDLLGNDLVDIGWRKGVTHHRHTEKKKERNVSSCTIL